MDFHPDDLIRLLDTLGRIATALERIADNTEKRKPRRPTTVIPSGPVVPHPDSW